MTSSMLSIRDWSQAPARQALAADALADALASLPGWQLQGQGAEQAIAKTFHFRNYFETLAFVNALALVAHTQDHHPALEVLYNRCTVRWNTHDAHGVSSTDLDCARRTEGLLA